MDGSNAVELVTSEVLYPTDITLDLANEHVYWIDTYYDMVERVDYNGKNRWSMNKNPDVSFIYNSLFIKLIFFWFVYRLGLF